MTRKEIKKTNKKKKMKKKKGVGRKERDQGGRRGVTNGDGGMKAGTEGKVKRRPKLLSHCFLFISVYHIYSRAFLRRNSFV